MLQWLLGLAVSLAALALAALAIQIWAGLGNYLHWTVAYAAERRWPSPPTSPTTCRIWRRES